MSENEKVINKEDDENADVEAHKHLAKHLAATDEKTSDDEDETPDVEAHKHLA